MSPPADRAQGREKGGDRCCQGNHIDWEDGEGKTLGEESAIGWKWEAGGGKGDNLRFQPWIWEVGGGNTEPVTDLVNLCGGPSAGCRVRYMVPQQGGLGK